jgi:pimeloyl-ACP methyl ester carboxylesterase
MPSVDARSGRSTGDERQQRHPVILLPGGIALGAIRYASLLKALGDTADVLIKDLEVYAGDTPPENYSIELEVEGISRAANEAGFERFHLYGHSAGGGIALAYVATNPERLLSLALDEPDSFFPEAKAEYRRIKQLPSDEQLEALIAAQLAPGVELPPSPDDEPEPEWMANRPAGIAEFGDAVQRYELPPDRFRGFSQPVYYSYGSLSNRSLEELGTRLGGLFPDFTMERYDGLHHFNTSHVAEPERVAASLKRLWRRAEQIAGESRPA